MSSNTRGASMATNYDNITLTITDLDRIKLPKFQSGFV